MAMTEAADNAVYEPGSHPDLPPPASERGAIGWLRHNLFSSWTNSALTVIAVALIVVSVPPILNWLIFDATWSVPPEALAEGRAARFTDCAQGAACWLFVDVRIGQFFYGFYPLEERWRANLVFAILVIAGYLLLSPQLKRKRGIAIFFFAVFPFLAFWLLYGGLGLEVVPTQQWGGFMMTLILGVVGIIISLPLGVLLALGRRSTLPIIQSMSVIFIEFVRGVPLITVLFMANLMLPLFLPPGWEINILVRVLVGVILFSAAYVAEVVRGGLQAIPKGQYEGAVAMGLGYWQMMRLVILPQALKISIPGLVNSFIGLFMDTTLVAMVGLYDFLNMVRAGSKDANWVGAELTGYVFCAMVYWICCFGMSRYSMYLERRLHTGHKRH